jgi:hypothetical protein
MFGYLGSLLLIIAEMNYSMVTLYLRLVSLKGTWTASSPELNFALLIRFLS